MESLEEYNLLQQLNFRSSHKFLTIVEEELAGLILRLQQVDDSGQRIVLQFPPLKPKYAQLLHAMLVRFELPFIVKDWGEARHLVVSATQCRGTIPALRCSDFRPCDAMAAPRLEVIAKPTELLEPDEKDEAMEQSTESALQKESNGESRLDWDTKEDRKETSGKRPASPPSKRPRGRARGMRGWGDSEDEEEEEVPEKESEAKTGTNEGEGAESDEGRLSSGRGAWRPSASGLRVRGRGFLSEEAQAELEKENVGEDDGKPEVKCKLQGHYQPYEVDPEDTWRPQRKPYVTLGEQGRSWEFHPCWSFEPEERPDRPPPQEPAELCGVAKWMVQHDEAQHYAVALGQDLHQLRQWVERWKGPGEEPYVLDFYPEPKEKCWSFRFGRLTTLEDVKWKTIPFTNNWRSSFWLATFVGQEDRKRYVCAGFDNFPEKRFFSARLAAPPSFLGFGLQVRRVTLTIRDITVFARSTLLGAPFAGRDHFVQVEMGEDKVRKVLKKARLDGILTIAPLLTHSQGAETNGDSELCLLVCEGAEQAAAAASALGAVAKVASSAPWTWPPAGLEPGTGPEAAKAAESNVEEEQRGLATATIREMMFFKEGQRRKTSHLEAARARPEDGSSKLETVAMNRIVKAGLHKEAPSQKSVQAPPEEAPAAPSKVRKTSRW